MATSDPRLRVRVQAEERFFCVALYRPIPFFTKRISSLGNPEPHTCIDDRVYMRRKYSETKPVLLVSVSLFDILVLVVTHARSKVL